MSKPAHWTLSLALGALTACIGNDEVPPSFDGPITLSGTSLWAGQTLTLESADFAQIGSTDSVIVLVGDSASRATRVDATRYAVTLPTVGRGPFPVRVRWRGLEQFAPSVTLYGFDRFESTSVRFWNDQQVVRREAPQIVAIDASTSRYAMLDVISGAVTPIPVPAANNGCRGPGPTPDPGLFLLQRYEGPATALERWRLFPTPQLLDTLRGVTCVRQVMQLSTNRVFRSTHHYYELLTRPHPDSAFTSSAPIPGEETEGVTLSPRGDRAAIQIDFDQAGPPVFDVASGSIAWRATSFRGTTGAEFSPGGGWIALVGADSAHFLGNWGMDSPGQRVEIRWATDGSVVAARSFDRALMGAAYDPTVNLVYVILAEVREPGVSNAPSILVLDGSTLATRGHLRLPATVPGCLNGCYHAVAAVSAEPAIYVVAAELGTSYTARWRFTMPPVR